MRKFDLLGATALAMWAAVPAYAQTGEAAPTTANSGADASGIGDIVVTAQRQSETLQTVPIAVSAFSAEGLRQQQINTTSDLQLSLPNITFTKSNFTSSSSFNIRGIGDLCVGVTCDAATAVHVNDVPVIGSPIFQNEFFDVERIEVLRGPQGTLFGRNATGGVINFITAKPDLNRIHAAGEVEYGNYNSIRVKGMFNLPVTETIGVRLAGYYLKRDGFTRNLFDGKRIDGRDQYDIRGSIRWEPTEDTTLDIVGHYFHENDDRSRIQKQLCHRDPTGVLGCLPDQLAFEQLNGDATLAAILTSTEFINVALGPLAATFRPLALGSVYNTDGDVYRNFVNPPNIRTVNIDSPPRFRTEEKQVLVNFNQNFGSFGLKLDGGYTEGFTDSTVDYNVGVEAPLANNPGLVALNALAQAPGAAFPGGVNPFTPIRAALTPQGPGGPFCQSLADQQGVGVYGGKSVCAGTSLDFDRSTAYGKQWFAEGIVTSKFDGPFNFLIGAGYLDYKVRDNDYFVNSFSLDYAAGLLGAASAIGARAAGQAIPNVYRGTPFYDNDSRNYHLKSYGIFGEAYADITDTLKLTIGARYNHDEKFYRARTTLFNDANGNAVLVPFGSSSFTNAINYSTIDFDANVAGNQEFSVNTVSFGRMTGRAVLDWRITDRNLLYVSYSRGYKSGGINPPLSPIFAVPTSFGPEKVNAFEIGSKNTFLDGTARLNLTAFYYQYKDLQLSRIVARTSVNDNVNADIMGFEAEGILNPTRNLLINLSASFLKTRVSNDKFLANPQDPSGGRSDAVIIKDLTNAANCSVGSNSGNAAQTNALVSATNTLLGLRPTTPIPGTNTTGAFSVCGILQAAAAGNVGAAVAALAAPNPALGGLTGQQFINLQVTGNPATAGQFTYYASGVPVNIRGNNLPQSPHFKFSAGMQYTFDFGNGWNIVPRIDLNYTGNYYGSIFNRRINRIEGYEIVNAQVQLNAPDDRFYARLFVQNLTKNNAVTGLYVTDQSSGLFTNAFSLEPRRYGIAAGFRF
ncbi:TonB-dependent receptor [Sphingomonas sp. ID1715]|uniref:TonB-dependent receptor n=1 Tax=Sphingomonas sp. ID1715 TaxID=1656898 RepID=UPI001489E938|nr:TonB-dependent receptor [Sphingomonas sp. ID1715]NNM75586.1 TonB-dependent receptor [Sphingomonas sp. ID1715]